MHAYIKAAEHCDHPVPLVIFHHISLQASFVTCCLKSLFQHLLVTTCAAKPRFYVSRAVVMYTSLTLDLPPRLLAALLLVIPFFAVACCLKSYEYLIRWLARAPNWLIDLEAPDSGTAKEDFKDCVLAVFLFFQFVAAWNACYDSIKASGALGSATDATVPTGPLDRYRHPDTLDKLSAGMERRVWDAEQMGIWLESQPGRDNKLYAARRKARALVSKAKSRLRPQRLPGSTVTTWVPADPSDDSSSSDNSSLSPCYSGRGDPYDDDTLQTPENAVEMYDYGDNDDDDRFSSTCVADEERKHITELDRGHGLAWRIRHPRRYRIQKHLDPVNPDGSITAVHKQMLDQLNESSTLRIRRRYLAERKAAREAKKAQRKAEIKNAKDAFAAKTKAVTSHCGLWGLAIPS